MRRYPEESKARVVQMVADLRSDTVSERDAMGGSIPPSAVNRTLAYLDLPGGRDFSAESVRAGMSKVVTYGKRPVALFDDLTAAEAAAKDQHTGLWGAPCWGSTDSVPV